MNLITNALLIFLAVIGVMVVIYLYTLTTRRAKVWRKIKATWGQEPKEIYGTDDMASIASYHENKKQMGEIRFSIDDITSNDLDLDKVFKRLNATHTSVGEEYLYHQLRALCFDGEVLTERDRVIRYFQQHPEERRKIQFILESVGKLRQVNVSDYMLDFSQMLMKHAWIYKALAALNLLSIVLTFINMQGFLLLVISFFVNMTVFYRAKNRLDSQLNSIGYVTRVIDMAKRIMETGIEDLKPYNGKLEASYKRLAGARKAGNSFMQDSGGDPIREYYKIVLMSDLNHYNKVLRILKGNQDAFKELYETIGFLDSMISIASYRESLKVWCTPKLTAKGQKKTHHLKAVEVCHPLIKEPVLNTIELSSALLLTGSNASGKSTFLKSLALNAIFAQTIVTCLAKEYEGNYSLVFTSMALRDDLSSKESYFIAEIKSLKRICDAVNEDIPTLCFIDEILRGTNTIERIASSSRALQHLSQGNCLCAAATHDIELPFILGNRFDNYHFREAIQKDEIIFDYKLYKGKSTTRNAIKLLGLMGFDTAIVQEAEKAAHVFEKEGTWKTLAD